MLHNHGEKLNGTLANLKNDFLQHHPILEARSNLINTIRDSLNTLHFIKYPLGHIIRCYIKQKGDKLNSSLIIEAPAIKIVFK